MNKPKSNQPWFKFALLSVVVLILLAFSLQTDNGKYFEISKNIEIFTNLYKEINTYYVDDLDPSKLMRTGVDAMMESLDPYTRYISESEIEGFRYITEGRYNGIGAQIEFIRDFATITATYKNSPANKAGLKPGDQIIEVSGNTAKGRTPEEVNQILRGAMGTDIELTIRRPGEAKEITVNLVRDEVQIPNVPYYGMVTDEIGYISLTTFTRDAGKNVADALRTLRTENPNLKGVIFDLRNNGGGLLTEAVNVSNVFVPKGELVVTTKGKVKDWDRSFKTLNAPIDETIPLIVLINKNSASASEIVSGVIQDYDRGVLLGQRSYGKGLVQNTRDVGYNSKVKMTTAKYYIPSGRCIQSVQYEDGEPVDIPDTDRAKFTTRNGRTVLDGGGVKPDVKVRPLEDAPVISALMEEFLIFDFVTEYVQTLDLNDIDQLDQFHFTDWDRFQQFLEKRDFKYESKTGNLLAQLKETAMNDGLPLEPSIEEMQATVQQVQATKLAESKGLIMDLIEKEIAGRFFFLEGNIRMGLRNDPEIKEAVQLLGDQDAYANLLK